MTKSRFDIKEGIRTQMPSLFELIGDSKISWKGIQKSVNKFIDSVEEEAANKGGEVLREYSFYSILIRKNKGESCAQYDFYTQLFNELRRVLSPKERRIISGTLRSVLSHVNKDHLNFIGELSVLYFYKINGPFDLIKIEERITDKSDKTADFLFFDRERNIEFLIEVLNIHLEDNTNLRKDEFHKKIFEKIELKKNEKPISSTRLIAIQPFIWMKDYDQINLVSDCFRQSEYFPSDYAILPLAYLSLIDSEGKFYPRINFVNEILDFNKGIY